MTQKRYYKKEMDNSISFGESFKNNPAMEKLGYQPWKSEWDNKIQSYRNKIYFLEDLPEDTDTYQEKRAQNYPPIEEQLDNIWHLMDEGILGEAVKKSKFFQSIKNIKTKFPKETIND